MVMRAVSLAALVGSAAGHGHMTIPASTRNGGDMATGGSCRQGQCFWFSNNVEIPGKISLPNDMRSLQLNVTGQPEDVYATSPWRAPGTAPVYGHGCGSAGGGPVGFANGGQPPAGVKQGFDGLDMPKHGEPAQWKRGTNVDVAWAISANHGGGYAYRLCKADGNITEECFQAGHLEFAGETQWARYPNGTQVEMPLRMTAVGTFPKGSQWARDPIPECYECDAYKTCGAPLPPQPNDEIEADVVAIEHFAVDAHDKFQCKAVTKAQCNPKGNPKAMGNCLKCSSEGNGDHCETCCDGTVLTPYVGKGMNLTYCASKGGGGGGKIPATCKAALATDCGSAAKKSPLACGVCAGEHMASLKKAGCTTTNVDAFCGGGGKKPGHGGAWEVQVNCYGACAGSASSKAGGVCPGELAFPAGAQGFTGFGKITWPWSVVDKVKIPATLPAGEYLLSWRWDCEESTQ